MLWKHIWILLIARRKAKEAPRIAREILRRARTNETDKRNDISANIRYEIIPPIEWRGKERERTTDETLTTDRAHEPSRNGRTRNNSVK